MKDTKTLMPVIIEVLMLTNEKFKFKQDKVGKVGHSYVLPLFGH